MIEVLVNGVSQKLPEGLSLTEALKALAYQGEHLAVAINQTCVPRSAFAQTTLKPGDDLEILSPMAGG